jgi:lysophospholipase L1-like esterase
MTTAVRTRSDIPASTTKLVHARSVLAAGQPFTLLVLGDSVAAGCSASTYRTAFPSLWAHELREAHHVPVRLVNLAVAGRTSEDGLAEAEEAARDYRPDLAVVAFGLNDRRPRERTRRHPFTAAGPRVPVSAFRGNMLRIADRLRRRGGTDVVFVSPCALPDVGEYRQMLVELAECTEFALADVGAAWPADDDDGFLDEERLHPNDAGHRLYADALSRLGL